MTNFEESGTIPRVENEFQMFKMSIYLRGGTAADPSVSS